MMRRPLVVGNWKMNGLLATARALVEGIASGLQQTDAPVDVGIAPPAVLLMPMCKAVADTPIRLGAQNVYCEQSGAFTGEISPAMIRDAGCSFVLIGHSERRQLFGETGELLRRKVTLTLETGLQVIYCIGETDEQRTASQTRSVLQQQLAEALVESLDWTRMVVAYEPVWAIGTGKNATEEQAQDAHLFIRSWLKEKYGSEAAAAIRILYGGSVKPANAHELLGMADVDGALVGGASLRAEDFLEIINAAATTV